MEDPVMPSPQAIHGDPCRVRMARAATDASGAHCSFAFNELNLLSRSARSEFSGPVFVGVDAVGPRLEVRGVLLDAVASQANASDVNTETAGGPALRVVQLRRSE